MNCPRCSYGITPVLINENRLYGVRGDEIHIMDHVMQCPYCQEEWSAPGFDSLAEVYRVYREKNHMLQPETFRAWREKNKLSLLEIATYLHVDESEISRFESGGLPNQISDNDLRCLLESDWDDIAKLRALSGVPCQVMAGRLEIDVSELATPISNIVLKTTEGHVTLVSYQEPKVFKPVEAEGWTRFLYLREGGHPKAYLAITKRWGKLYFGISRCDPSDRFLKSVAREIAEARIRKLHIRSDLGPTLLFAVTRDLRSGIVPLAYYDKLKKFFYDKGFLQASTSALDSLDKRYSQFSDLIRAATEIKEVPGLGTPTLVGW